jgi:hypothetical protein
VVSVAVVLTAGVVVPVAGVVLWVLAGVVVVVVLGGVLVIVVVGVIVVTVRVGPVFFFTVAEPPKKVVGWPLPVIERPARSSGTV